MRSLALIAAVLALAACQTTRPPVVPQIVRVPVETMIPVPAKLSKDCARPAKQADTYGEAIRLANVRDAALAECNKRMAEIRALGQKP